MQLKVTKSTINIFGLRFNLLYASSIHKIVVKVFLVISIDLIMTIAAVSSSIVHLYMI